MRKTNPNLLITLLATAGLLFATGTAVAQDQPQMPEPAPTVEVSDQDVEKFAQAYVAIQTINQEYAAKLQTVEKPEESAELQQEAQNKMQQAVTDSGLSISDYQEIAQAANQDEEVRSGIEEALAAMSSPDSQPE